MAERQSHVLVTMGTTPETLPLAGVRTGILQQLSERGLTPILVHASMGERVIRELYKDAQGLVIPGGPDVDPAYYGQYPHPKTRATDPDRDRLEMGLLDKALPDELQLLLFCRGLQVLNIHEGGTLYQENEDIEGIDGNIQHSSDDDYQRLPKNNHKVHLLPGTKLRTIFDADTIERPSGHHQSIHRVGSVLVVEARAHDGVIEAAGIPGDIFREGVQWHEELIEDSPLITAFAEAVHGRPRQKLPDWER